MGVPAGAAESGVAVARVVSPAASGVAPVVEPALELGEPALALPGQLLHLHQLLVDGEELLAELGAELPHRPHGWRPANRESAAAAR